MPTIDPNVKAQELGINLSREEKPLEVVQKHWGHIVPVILGLIVLVVATILIPILLSTSGVSGNQTTLFFIITVGILYTLLVGYGLSEWYSYQHSALVITNQRLIDQSQLNFFSSKVNSIDIHTVKRTIPEPTKPLERFFNFGTVKVEQIGDGDLTIRRIPAPEVMAEQIMHYHNFVAHAGSASAHNIQAKTPLEDTTPQLEEALEKLQEEAVNQPPAAQSLPGQAAEKTAGLPTVDRSQSKESPP